MLVITTYEPADAENWNEFLGNSRNGVFQFNRAYMEYHHDRFFDFSILIRKNRKLIGLIPGHIENECFVSHSGLTFGGLVMANSAGVLTTVEIFNQLICFLKDLKIKKLVYKPTPHIYHRQPAEDDIWVLNSLGARITKIDLSTTVDLQNRFRLSSGRRNALSRAKKAGIIVRKVEDWKQFWLLLEAVLLNRHGVKPTHEVHEIEALAKKFGQIGLLAAYIDAEMIAGAVVYQYVNTIHTQYLASSIRGRETGALDAIISTIIETAEPSIRWLNFGTSTTHNGTKLNEGLVSQKEMFGGRSTVLQTLELDLEYF